MDPAQGESGGGKSSLTSKLKAKVPHPRVKDKVKNLKNRLPGMKKHGVEQEEAHEDSSEYDENSPRGPGPETGHNVADSPPLTTGKTTPDSNSPSVSPRDVHNPDYDYKPAQTGYDAHDVAAAPPTRPAPLAADAPRPNLAPAALEENFQHLDVGDKTSTDPTPTDNSFQPEQQQPSSSSTESVQKGYSDAPRNNSYRSNTSSSPTSNKGMLEKVKETVAGATAVLGDKMGYYNDHAPADPNAPSILAKAKSTLGVDKPRDPNAPSLLAKAKSTLGVDKPRDPNAPSLLAKAKSTLGTRDPNAPPLTERAKAYMSVASQKTREYSATAKDHAAWTKDRVAAQTTPTHHDKALSEQVTQSLSSLPGAIKEKVFGPASPGSANPASPTSPGIVNRVSGAVSSLFTSSSPKETGANLQHTFPAHSDHDAAAAASAPSAPADRSSVPPATSTPDYPTVNN